MLPIAQGGGDADRAVVLVAPGAQREPVVDEQLVSMDRGACHQERRSRRAVVETVLSPYLVGWKTTNAFWLSESRLFFFIFFLRERLDLIKLG